jgi:hypothetical protein
MSTFKRFWVLAAAVLAAASAVMGQEMSVEESYLQESVELMIIKETSQADSRDQKEVAMMYISAAIERGNKGEDIRQALEYLASEGITRQTRMSGRLTNNFPDIRRQAAKYLGDIGTVEAKNTLVKMCLTDNEPMVLQEAFKSLGNIGINDNDEVVSVIAFITARFDVLNPDNMLALAAIDALDKIAAKNNGIKDPNAIRTLMRIGDGRYIKPVQERAKQVLMNLRNYQKN